MNKKLRIKVQNISSLSEEEYVLARKDSFGASDSSVLCDVNLYKTLDQLLKEKQAKYVTDEEREVSKKPIVKKGKELEAFILTKAEKELGMSLIKPDDMYELVEEPSLTINYDGVGAIDQYNIPVEIKLVSKYGEKYYNKNITIEDAKQVDMKIEGDSLKAHITRKATRLGIPPYYYTQCQQEMLGLDSPYGYLGAMFDDSWEFKLYYIPADPYVQNKIIDIARKHKDKL